MICYLAADNGKSDSSTWGHDTHSSLLTSLSGRFSSQAPLHLSQLCSTGLFIYSQPRQQVSHPRWLSHIPPHCRIGRERPSRWPQAITLPSHDSLSDAASPLFQVSGRRFPAEASDRAVVKVDTDQVLVSLDAVNRERVKVYCVIVCAGCRLSTPPRARHWIFSERILPGACPGSVLAGKPHSSLEPVSGLLLELSRLQETSGLGSCATKGRDSHP